MAGRLQWFLYASQAAKAHWLFPAYVESTTFKTGALTVAGQWRIFTAFPNILAIALVNNAAQRNKQQL